MLVNTRIAYPYAQAAFAIADQDKTLPLWERFLVVVQQVVQEASIKDLLMDPRIVRAKQYLLLIDICRYCLALTSAQENFLRLVIQHRRVLYLPAIYHCFLTLRAANSSVVEATITSPWPLSGSHQQLIENNLRQHFRLDLHCHLQQDPTLLAGFVLRAGDFVLDASLKDRLRRARAILLAGGK